MTGDQIVMSVIFILPVFIFYYIAVLVNIQNFETTAQVLVSILFPFFGIVIAFAMRRINEIERETEETKGKKL